MRRSKRVQTPWKPLDVYKRQPLPDKKPRFADAPDQITAILKHLIERGKGMEVNTSTYGKEGFTMPDLEIVRRYRELGEMCIRDRYRTVPGPTTCF